MANVYNRVSGLFLTLKMFLHQVFKLCSFSPSITLWYGRIENCVILEPWVMSTYTHR